MKDEEMAEEWWNSWVVKDWNDLQEGKRLFIQAFLAGLKAGRPQWHKVADGDYPKGRCLVFYKDTSGVISYSVVHPSWYIAGIKAFFENNPRIIAWCEDFERLEHTIGERNVNQNDINAWKEIVLPELPKEIE